MATKIRLQRGGRKGYAFYSIVIADVRAPRDGKFTEKIGTYNPNTNPATVDLNFDRALYWVETGAQPTDTVRNILQREGVYLMKHLRGGVKKGAFDESEVQKRFDAWKAAKEQKLNATRENVAKAKKAVADKELEQEKQINEAIAKKVAEKKAAAAVAAAEAAAGTEKISEGKSGTVDIEGEGVVGLVGGIGEEGGHIVRDAACGGPVGVNPLGGPQILLQPAGGHTDTAARKKQAQQERTS